MIRPSSLRPGDEIRIVSPASPIRPDQIEFAVRLLESEGYKVSLGDHVFASTGYLAGPDADRAADVMKAFTDPAVRCVLCARGGYGCARLIEYLDLDIMAASGRMFCGFSDVTTLHLALNRRGLVTFHTPMPITLSSPRDPWVIDSFLGLLRGVTEIPSGAPRPQVIVPGSAEGVLTGGCLCLLTDSLATPDALDCTDRIVVIEDVDEHPHRIDAMLTHLRNAGQASKAAAFVIGEMTRTDERSDPAIGAWPWQRIVEDRLGGLGIPLVIGFPFGHMPNMLSFPLGVRARLNASSGILEVVESAFTA